MYREILWHEKCSIGDWKNTIIYKLKFGHSLNGIVDHIHSVLDVRILTANQANRERIEDDFQ